MRRVVFVLLTCLIAGAALIHAEPVRETDFWRLLERTTQALLQPAPDLDSLREQWATIDGVQFDSIVSLDLDWIRDALADGTVERRQQLRLYIVALLDYHTQQTEASAGGGLGASLNELDNILSDPRFQYPQIEPTALPPLPAAEYLEIEPASGDGSVLGQAFLFLLGTGVVIVVLSYLARTINVKGAQLKTTSASDEDPTTFAEARERAEHYEAAHNYRAAIRYLYLSSLLLLDERNLIHYDSSLTNREHLRQIASTPPLFNALRQVINTFEDVWYGFEPVDDSLYQQYRLHIDQLRRLIL